jgi:methyltransferase
MSRLAYLFLLALVGLGRLIELRVSLRNRRGLVALGAAPVPEAYFPFMVAIHAGVLASAAAEAWFLRRPFIPALAIAMGTVFLLANLLRWWVIRTLNAYWTVVVVDSAPLGGVVTGGPYRWVRHPNYVAVIAELFSLPMIYTCWITAIWGTLANAEILRRRLRTEEAVLVENPQYVLEMAWKPRFFPRIFP